MGAATAVSVIGSKTIEKFSIEDSHDLSIVNFGLLSTKVSATRQLSLRGMSTGYSATELSNNLAFYTDQPYITAQAGGRQFFFDMENMYILKGPQGSLYGRNAAGGAILFSTRNPDLESLFGYAQAGFGELPTAGFDRENSAYKKYAEFKGPRATGLIHYFCEGFRDSAAAASTVDHYAKNQMTNEVAQQNVLDHYATQMITGDTLNASISAEFAALNVDFEPTESLMHGFFGVYLDGKYLDYSSSTFVPAYLAKRSAQGFTAGLAKDLSGYQTASSLELTSSGDIPYRFNICQAMEGEVAGMIFHSDEYDMIAAAGGPSRLNGQDSLTMVNLTFSINYSDGWVVEFYVTNSFAEQCHFELQTQADGTCGGTGWPRMEGARVSYDF